MRVDTPLHGAAMYGITEAVKLLVQHPAINVNPIGTVLFIICIKFHNEF